ncbi:MAG TPA: hypothetical protein VHR47_06585 [Bacillota bacterium]|nr:hypothetical protein [Bacillota bacterium]
MPWQSNLPYLMNSPVGVSLMNGQGVSGILCDASNDTVYLLQYLYQSQFAMMQYPFNRIQDITPFPSCDHQGRVY